MAIFEHRPPRSRRPRTTPDLELDGDPRHADREAADEPDGAELRGREEITAGSLLDLPLDEPAPSSQEETGAEPSRSWGPREAPPATEHLPSAVREPSRSIPERPQSKPVRRRPAPGGVSEQRRRTVQRRSGPPPGGRARPERIGGGGLRWLGALLLIAIPLAAYLGYRLNLDPPVVVMSSEILDFGEQRLAEAADDQGVRLVNQGEEPLLISDLAIEGEAALDFMILAEDCRERPLERDDLCRVGIGFTPSAGGERRARLRVRSNGINGTASLPLLGRGTSARLAIRPERQSFGELTLGLASPAEEFELRNEGSAVLAVAQVALDGAGAADFVLRRDRCSRQRLAPGESCSVDLVFVPTVEGERRASLRVTSDASGPTEPIWVDGLGLPQRPELQLEPERLDLGAWPLGVASEIQQVEITNAGNGPVEWRELRLTSATGEGEAPGFERVGGDCGTVALAPGERCTVELRFRARREGEALGLLEVLHGAEDLHRLPLLAVGTAPRVFVDQERLAFDEGPVGSRSAPRSVRLSSTGSAPLTVSAVELVGADARAFAVDSGGCEARLDPGSNCGLAVRFSPRRDGPHRAQLVIRHDAEGDTERVTLVGLGVSPKLEVEATRLDFGQVASGDTAERQVVARNTGRAPLALESLRLGGRFAGDYRVTTDRCSGRTLEPGRQCSVTVVFTAGAMGTRAAQLTVTPAGGQAVEVSLTASASEPPKPRLSVQPGRMAFAEQSVGGSSSIQTLTLRNGGRTPLRLERIGLGGADAAAFQLVAGSCSDLEALSPGEDCTMGLRFAPTREGNHRAELVILHSGEGSRHTLPLDGSGRATVPGG